jgi:hypothetical protein
MAFAGSSQLQLLLTLQFPNGMVRWGSRTLNSKFYFLCSASADYELHAPFPSRSKSKLIHSQFLPLEPDWYNLRSSVYCPPLDWCICRLREMETMGLSWIYWNVVSLSIRFNGT